MSPSFGAPSRKAASTRPVQPSLRPMWDGGAPILKTYPIECEAKQVEELVIEDAEKGIGFMILAVTAEVAGATLEEPVLDVTFTTPGVADRRWREGQTGGWLECADQCPGEPAHGGQRLRR